MRFRILLAITLGFSTACIAQTPSNSTKERGNEQLRMVLLLSRHGVRAPLASEIRDNVYNAQAWPSWPVPAGVLTEHGARALELLGGWYREHYTSLSGPIPCSAIYAIADNSERDVASAHAMLQGFAAGCNVEVHSRHGRERDPLFNTGPYDAAANRELLAAAIAGSLGGQSALDANPAWWTNAFQQPLDDLQRILTSCEPGPACRSGLPRVAEGPTEVAAAQGGDLVTVRTPVSIGADFAEHFLLEYTEGMAMSQVGWGRVSRPMLDHLMTMNTRYHDFVLRTPYYAQIAASDLAARINATLETAAKPKANTSASPLTRDASTRVVLLEGHDSNLTWLGGLLRLRWLAPDQPMDATPPGSSLVFELWRNTATGADSVRVLYVGQTLEQIRSLAPLTHGDGPAVAPVFVPGCSSAEDGYPCTLGGFTKVIDAAVNPDFVDHSDLP